MIVVIKHKYSPILITLISTENFKNKILGIQDEIQSICINGNISINLLVWYAVFITFGFDIKYFKFFFFPFKMW